MRLLGDLHRGSRGGAEVEQVGEAVGRPPGGPSPGTRLLQAHLPAGKVSLNAWPLQCEIPGQLLGFNHFSLGK